MPQSVHTFYEFKFLVRENQKLFVTGSIHSFLLPIISNKMGDSGEGNERRVAGGEGEDNEVKEISRSKRSRHSTKEEKKARVLPIEFEPFTLGAEKEVKVTLSEADFVLPDVFPQFPGLDLELLKRSLTQTVVPERNPESELDEFSLQVKKTLQEFNSVPRASRLEVHRQLLVCDENTSVYSYNPDRNRYTLTQIVDDWGGYYPYRYSSGFVLQNFEKESKVHVYSYSRSRKKYVELFVIKDVVEVSVFKVGDRELLFTGSEFFDLESGETLFKAKGKYLQVEDTEFFLRNDRLLKFTGKGMREVTKLDAKYTSGCFVPDSLGSTSCLCLASSYKRKVVIGRIEKKDQEESSGVELKILQTLEGDSVHLLDDKTVLVGNTQKQKAFVCSHKEEGTWEAEISFPVSKMLFFDFEAIGVWHGGTHTHGGTPGIISTPSSDNSGKVIRWSRSERKFDLLYTGELDIYARMLSPHLLIRSSTSLEATVLDLGSMKEMCKFKFLRYRDFISLDNPKEKRKFTGVLLSLLPVGAIPKDVVGVITGFL